MDLLDRLLGYDRFTTDGVLTLCRDLPDADLDRDVDIGNRSIRRTVVHLLAAMELWTGLMAGERRGHNKPTIAAIDGFFARHATILPVIAWHNVHHRGEVLHMLQRLGIPDLPDGNSQEWEHLTGRI